MAKYTVTFQINKYEESTPALLESELQDLLTSSVLPALNSELIPLTFTVRKARS